MGEPERILRKTVEIIEKPSPRSRTTINLEKKSTTFRKAIFFMELLWKHGFHQKIHYQTLECYVENFLGGFRQTKQFYLGRLRVTGRGVGNKVGVWVPGLLEKLHYIEKEGSYWVLHHELVPLDYHCVESLDGFQHTDEDCKQGSMEKFSLTGS